MFKPLAVLAAFATLIAAGPASAGPAGDIARDALYSGSHEQGIAQLTPLSAADDPEATFGLGLIELVSALEGLAQDLYRHGLTAPDTRAAGVAMMVPLPANPNPEPLDYAKVRAMLERLVSGLDAAGARFEAAGRAGEYVVLLDPLQIRIDANGDGQRDASESIERVFTAALGTPPTAMPEGRPTEPPPAANGKTDKSPALTDPALSVSPTTIGFDRADAIWLAGYSQVFAAQADFFLAHDFEQFVNVAFHRFFPKARLPMQDYAEGGMLLLDPSTDTAIADAVAAIHSINWPVIEPGRLAGVLERLKKITTLSRANWDAILTETDDNRELVPSPKQTSVIPEGRVTNEVVAAWRETLDTADKVLAGDLLVPHWRFRQGFDLNRYFTTAERFDLVMLLDGFDALPFLADGPVASAESFAAANRVFGDQWLGYVFWFN